MSQAIDSVSQILCTGNSAFNLWEEISLVLIDVQVSSVPVIGLCNSGSWAFNILGILTMEGPWILSILLARAYD